MKRLKGLSGKRWLKGQQGSVMVEFAIILPVLLLLVFGIIDFGHALYMKAEVTAASREGARYAVKYHTNAGGSPVAPNALTPSVGDWVYNNYGATGKPLENSDLTVPTPTGAGYTSGTPGADVTVTVNATKNWFVLGRFISAAGFPDPLPLSSSTTMKCE